jgi:hypothetical protein
MTRAVAVAVLVLATAPAASASADPRDTTAPRLTRVRVVRRQLRFTPSERTRVRIVVRRTRFVRVLDRAGGGTGFRCRIRAR